MTNHQFRRPLVYLASPYSSRSPSTVTWRVAASAEASMYLMRENYLVYSPLLQSHHIWQLGLSGSDWNTWREVDLALLEHCDKLVILMLPGWEESVGVRDEIEYAKHIDLPMWYLSPVDAGITNPGGLELAEQRSVPLCQVSSSAAPSEGQG